MFICVFRVRSELCLGVMLRRNDCPALLAAIFNLSIVFSAACFKLSEGDAVRIPASSAAFANILLELVSDCKTLESFLAHGGMFK